MTYQEVLENIGATTERSVLRDFNNYLADEITLEMFVELGTVTISAAQQQGRYAAEVSLMAWLQAAGLEPVPVASPPISHYRDSGRIRKGLATIVGAGVLDPDVTQNRLGRLAYAETVESSQQTFGEVLRRSPYVDGWVRSLEPGACELCQHWSRDGQEWPSDHMMPTHKGCTCTQVPKRGTK